MSPRKGVAFGAIGFGAVAATAALFLVLGPPRDRDAPLARPTPAPVTVTAHGFTLASVAESLPIDDVAFPPGPGVAAVQANCSGCHSPAMIVGQARLSRAQWQASVEKMRKIYRARIAAADEPAILTYLESLGAPR